MNLKESICRTYNLVAISIIGLSAFAFAPEIILENDTPDKIDDFILFILGLIGIAWYKNGTNRFSRTIAPIVFMALALLTKIGAIFIELDDKDSVGDDFGALILFSLSLIFVIYLYRQTAMLLESADKKKA